MDSFELVVAEAASVASMVRPSAVVFECLPEGVAGREHLILSCFRLAHFRSVVVTGTCVVGIAGAVAKDIEFGTVTRYDLLATVYLAASGVVEDRQDYACLGPPGSK